MAYDWDSYMWYRRQGRYDMAEYDLHYQTRRYWREYHRAVNRVFYLIFFVLLAGLLSTPAPAFEFQGWATFLLILAGMAFGRLIGIPLVFGLACGIGALACRHDGDPAAATRLAIVKAAAAIGRKMKEEGK